VKVPLPLSTGGKGTFTSLPGGPAHPRRRV